MRIALHKTQHPANLGFTARAMANFGLKELILVDPQCSKEDDEAIATSSHARPILENAIVVKSLKEMNEAVLIGTTAMLGTDYNLLRTPLSPKAAANFSAGCILFGNEASGLSNEDLAYCDLVVSIPASKEYPTLNLSHAVAIVCYEWFAATNHQSSTSHFVPQPREERERLHAKFNELLDALDFPTPEKRETQKRAWRRILEKAQLTRREAQAAFGFLTMVKRKKR